MFRYFAKVFFYILLFGTFSKSIAYAQEEAKILQIKYDSINRCYIAKNELGDIVIPCYKSIRSIGSGLYEVSKMDKHNKILKGVYDHNGKILIPVEYTFVGFSDFITPNDLLLYGYERKNGYQSSESGAIQLSTGKKLPESEKRELWSIGYIHFRTKDSSLVFNQNLELVFKTEKNLIEPLNCYFCDDQPGLPIWVFANNRYAKKRIIK